MMFSLWPKGLFCFCGIFLHYYLNSLSMSESPQRSSSVPITTPIIVPHPLFSFLFSILISCFGDGLSLKGLPQFGQENASLLTGFPQSGQIANPSFFSSTSVVFTFKLISSNIFAPQFGQYSPIVVMIFPHLLHRSRSVPVFDIYITLFCNFGNVNPLNLQSFSKPCPARQTPSDT